MCCKDCSPHHCAGFLCSCLLCTWPPPPPPSPSSRLLLSPPIIHTALQHTTLSCTSLPHRTLSYIAFSRTTLSHTPLSAHLCVAGVAFPDSEWCWSSFCVGGVAVTPSRRLPRRSWADASAGGFLCGVTGKCCRFTKPLAEKCPVLLFPRAPAKGSS